ncbi:hypothetical protein Tco_0110614 [Tanacetum coccineum]
MEVHSHIPSFGCYKGGMVNWVDDIDSDNFFYSGSICMLHEFRDHGVRMVRMLKIMLLEENEVLELEEREPLNQMDKITLNTLKDHCRKSFEVRVSKQKRRNPNTSVKDRVEPPEDTRQEEKKVQADNMCFGPLKDGFKAGWKSYFLGLMVVFVLDHTLPLLNAVGVKPKQWDLPLAYVVVEIEARNHGIVVPDA